MIKLVTGTVFGTLAADHVQRPRNRGPLVNANYGVEGEPGEGAFVEIWVVIKDGLVVDAAYRTHGCPSSICCASLLCEIAKGRPVETAMKVEAEDLITILGGLSEGRGYLAEWAVNSMRKAIEGEKR